MVTPPSIIQVDPAAIRGLDLTPLVPWTSLGAAELLALGPVLDLQFDWPLQEGDPRERSEIPELRLWSLRADALHPWLPLVLERSGGQLARHVAMLLPHGFSASEGLGFAPGSLELWITHRLFQLEAWGAREGVLCRANLDQMAAVLGYALEPAFWTVLDGKP
ncbi:CRR6 family NdhI maturation factor [Cyanobium sp. Morenito 9A2]|uniref:CRR6 family NdhI maturation factor n=1 Tax=Cyanobium sp. Morenito 9A2 TaxID=2823718 RepID=UPI0020CDA29B|nr:CRR6 family NdhI maturation factor [Cyanobium sp. Morenito 9A2]MCP9849294.1 CRR6 family NdhI maturation factor [Cyanobium sp. Morenito 9A2]